MPPALRQTGTPPPAEARVRMAKDRLLTALTKMNDRDTQRDAAADLDEMIKKVDQETLPVLLTALCSTGADQKVYARKAVAKALGDLASDVCPLHDAALGSYLGKLLAQLKRCLQDADSSVRDAAAEALASVACGLSHSPAATAASQPLAALPAAHGAAMTPPPHQQAQQVGTTPTTPGGAMIPLGSASSPLMKLLLDCLVEQKKELNAAACTALGMAAPYLGTLDSGPVRELLRRLSGSSTFQAQAALLAAFARVDARTGEPAGLLKHSPAPFLQFFNSFIGQPASSPLTSTSQNSAGGGSSSGSGVLGCLGKQDWALRRAAADCIRAAVLLLGPVMEVEGCWAHDNPKCVTARCSKALEGCKFDKVREVRDVAREALALLEDLVAYAGAGGGAAGWQAHAADRMRERGVALPTPSPGSPKAMPSRAHAHTPPRQPSPPPGGANGTPGERRSSPFSRALVAEEFRRAQQEDDVVMDAFARRRLDAGPAASTPDELTPPPLAKQSSSASAAARPGSAAGSRVASRQASIASTADRERPAGQQVTPQFPVKEVAGPADAAAQPAPAQSVSRQGSAVLRSGAPQAQGQGPPASSDTVSMSTAEWNAMQQQIKSLEAQQSQLLTALSSLTDTSSRTIAGLQERVRSLEAALQAATGSGATGNMQQPQAALPYTPPGQWGAPGANVTGSGCASVRSSYAEPLRVSHLTPLWSDQEPQLPGQQGPGGAAGGRAVSPSSRYAYDSPRVSLQLPGGSQDPLLEPGQDMEAAYRDALLGGPEGSGRGDMHLMRLLQRTGCVWSGLSHDTATRLLGAFVGYIQSRYDGSMLPKIMPWLWRLADEEHNSYQPPVELRHQVLGALAAVTATTDDPQVSEKVGLLSSTLAAHWSIRARTPSSSSSGVGVGLGLGGVGLGGLGGAPAATPPPAAPSPSSWQAQPYALYGAAPPPTTASKSMPQLLRQQAQQSTATAQAQAANVGMQPATAAGEPAAPAAQALAGSAFTRTDSMCSSVSAAPALGAETSTSALRVVPPAYLSPIGVNSSIDASHQGLASTPSSGGLMGNAPPGYYTALKGSLDELQRQLAAHTPGSPYKSNK